MTLRLRRRIKIAPGVHLNLGLRGIGLSVGPRGLHVGINRQGAYTSAGIPGTGLYAIHHLSSTPDEHPTVTGDASGFLIGVLIAAGLFAMLIVAAVSQ